MDIQWHSFHCLQFKGRRTSHLSQDKDGQPHDPLLLQVVRKGHRRRLGAGAGTARLMAITDCVDNGTQTDISFQNFLNGDRGSCPSSGSPIPPPSPPLAQLVEPYLLNDLWVSSLSSTSWSVLVTVCEVDTCWKPAEETYVFSQWFSGAGI